MGILGRVGSLVRSNLDDLVDRAEQPEKMIDQTILEMSTQLNEARRQIVASIADEKRLRKQWERELELARSWKKKAMIAIRAGEDSLAKEALVRRREHEELADEFQRQWETQSAGVEQLKAALRVLNTRIEEAKRKRGLLLAKQRRALAQQGMNRTLSDLSSSAPLEVFNRLEAKIERLDAEAEAASDMMENLTGDHLSQKIQQLEATEGLDYELLELKESMGLLPAVSVSAAIEELEHKKTPLELVSIEEGMNDTKPERLRANG